MNYEVETKFVFSGTFAIDADSPAQAKELIHKHCGLVMGRGINATLPIEKLNWAFNTKAETVTGRVRRIV